MNKPGQKTAMISSTAPTVREIKSPDRDDHLWRILDQQPFLLVLDRLERILFAYARMDAASTNGQINNRTQTNPQSFNCS